MSDYAPAASSDAAAFQADEGGSQPTLALQAHQRLIRERRARERSDEGLFGAYWAEINLDIEQSVVRRISYETARRVILDYEWLGSMPAVVYDMFGIFFDDVLGGVVVYGPEMSANLEDKFFDRLGVADKTIFISRGACVHWAHPHAASRLIRVSMRMLDDRWRVVTATTDPAAGEIGTIYQACGFYFLGHRWGTSDALEINGKLVNSRTLQTRYGTRSVLATHGKRVRLPAKGRYVAFRGQRAERAELLRRFQPWIEPYPKRATP